MVLKWCLSLFICAMVVCTVVSEGGDDVITTTESPVAVIAKARALQALMANMRHPDSAARLGEVLPLLRSMTRAQRVGLAEMLRTAPLVVAATKQAEANLTGAPVVAAEVPSPGTGLQLDVVSVLRRGDVETKKEEKEAARARAIELIEEVAAKPELFATNDTEAEEEEEAEDMPVPQELKGHKMSPGELLALISANRKLPPAQLVALIGEHHRRASMSRRPPVSIPGVNPAKRVPPNLLGRGKHGSGGTAAAAAAAAAGLKPPPRTSECDLLDNNICLEVPNYPREAIAASMQRNPMAVQAMLAPEQDLSIERRQDDAENLVVGGDEGSIHAVCQTSVKYARPKRARSVVGQWKYLVNMGNEHVQTMRIEMCNTPGEPCHYLANGVASQCVQLFSHHRLMAWTKEEGLHIDIFKVPTCCSCRVQPSYGPAMFPSSDQSHRYQSSRPRRPPPLEAEPEFVEDDEEGSEETEEDDGGQESMFTKTRVPPGGWRHRNRPQHGSYGGMKNPFQATVYESSTFPPLFNKDVRKRNRYRNKNSAVSRQDMEEDENEDMQDSASVPQHDRRNKPTMITSDQIRGSSNVAPKQVATPMPPGAITEPTRPSRVTSDDGSKINYSYHPIIDFFRNEKLVQQTPPTPSAPHNGPQQMNNRRSDSMVHTTANGGTYDDDWRPIPPSRPMVIPPLNHYRS